MRKGKGNPWYGSCAKFRWNFPFLCWRERINTHFCYYLPLENIKALLSILLPRIILNKFAWNSPNCFKEEVLKKVVYLFTLFLILHMYLPIGFGKVWRFIYASKPKFSFLAMMFCAELGWNWPRGSGDDEIVKSLCRQHRWGQLE